MLTEAWTTPRLAATMVPIITVLSASPPLNRPSHRCRAPYSLSAMAEWESRIPIKVKSGIASML